MVENKRNFRRSLSGTRIREQRRKLAIAQSALAKSVGISPSYLNLIEHNRRNASGSILKAISNELNIPIESLTEGAEFQLIEDLKQLGGSIASPAPELHAIEEFIGRFPGWAKVLSLQAKEISQQSATINTLVDRLSHDPLLQASLHEVLTSITAIRSTSGILATEAGIEPVQVDRFLSNIHDESIRMSDAAQSLVGYFEQTAIHAEQGEDGQTALDKYLSRHNFFFPSLETTSDVDKSIAQLIENEPLASTDEAKQLFTAFLRSYAQDARSLPADKFMATANMLNWSPSEIAAQWNSNLHVVFRRLACLSGSKDGSPNFGLIIVNAAGQDLFRRPTDGFPFGTSNGKCALWGVYKALSFPGTPLEQIVRLGGQREFMTQSIALPLSPPNFGSAPEIASAMLVTPMEMLPERTRRTAKGKSSIYVGTTCKLCKKSDCASRSDHCLSMLPE